MVLTRLRDVLAARPAREFWLGSGFVSVLVVLYLVVTGPNPVVNGQLTLHKLVTLLAGAYTLVSALAATFDAEGPANGEVSTEAVRSVLATTDVADPLTAREIAGILELADKQSLLRELRELAEAGDVESTLSDGNDILWWRPSSRRDEIVEEQRPRVAELVFRTEDGAVQPSGEWTDFEHEEAVLLYLVGKHYASAADAAEKPWATWGELTEEIDVDQRIKRSVAEALDSDSVTKLLQEQYDGANKRYRILVERLPDILDRIERSEVADEQPR